MEEVKTNKELRKDYYTNCLTIELNGESFSYDEAGKLYNAYAIIGDKETCTAIKSQMVKVKAKAKELFPDEKVS